MLLSVSFVSARYCNSNDVLGGLRKALYAYYVDPSESGFTPNELKALLSFYVGIESGQITVDCTPQSNEIDRADALADNIPSCSDGTKYGKCNNNTKPIYCYAGRLVPRCRLCGCQEEEYCDTTYVYTEKGNQGRWGKCYPLDVGCSVDSDCGTSGYIGDYYCDGGDVYRNYDRFTCVNPGNGGSSCINGTTAVLIDGCQAGEECVEGQSECQEVVTPNLCNDSDGGKDYYQKGYTNRGTSPPYVDSCYCPIGGDPNNLYACSEGPYLGEWFCNEADYPEMDGRVETGKIECTYICQDGACVNVTPDLCTDSDNGENINVYGSVSGNLDGSAYIHNDYCIDDGNVMEYYCVGDNYNSQVKQCGNDGFIGAQYCIGDTVYQDFKDYYCNSGKCTFDETPTFIEQCEFGCSEGECRINYLTARNFIVSYSDLEAQNCGAGLISQEHYACRAKRWCTSQGFETGLESEWGFVNQQGEIHCFSGNDVNKFVIPYSYLEAQGCGAGPTSPEHYACRAKRWCVSQGYEAGYQSEWDYNTQTGEVSCFTGDGIDIYLVSNNDLEAQGCGAGYTSPEHLACRAKRWCVSRGYDTGFQSEWGADYGGVVYCIRSLN